MPKMTHPGSSQTLDVAPDQVAMHKSQGWRVGEDAPPRSGAGSGRDAWAKYASGLGVTVPDDASRDDVILLVEQHAAQS